MSDGTFEDVARELEALESELEAMRGVVDEGKRPSSRRPLRVRLPCVTSTTRCDIWSSRPGR